MKTTRSTILLLTTTGLALASPSPSPSRTVEKRATTFCDQWGSLETAGYIVYNNLWGQDSADSGEQCTTVEDASGALAWSTAWTWAGGDYNVKSYANAVRQADAKALSEVASIPSSWSWSYTGTSIVANVAYDLFTSSSATGDAEYEVMIWLGALGGAGPISSTGSTIATPAVAGATWDLYYGLNGQMEVYSFVTQDAGATSASFSGDVADFVAYLADGQGFPRDSQFLLSAGAGTEPFVGTGATFTTTAYSLEIN
ncbi:putative glycoside hydrolase family 12 protein [Eutypa lata UCREL1]|uniref:Putative glycoside hydrolase family 12 protein n=1 Tax=Eutypa lata (strain UCR-EL1) TaxID=1287681 RepID=M7SX53_EUTLA|nr:putative glycoside hydrolase family 12 protein [Eutypa lata UCREL1]